MKINLENVSAGYGKNIIIHKFTSIINEGGVLGILGPNGSGKTTLLKVLSGILPYEGNLKIDDTELRTMSRYEISSLIAMMPQFSSQYLSYSVYDAVMLGRYIHRDKSLSSILGSPSKKDKEQVEYVLETTGLSNLAKSELSELSGGQLQRVLLARTMAQETPIILLDEPTNHLDLKHHIDLLNHLKKWSEGKTTVDGTEHKNTVISVFHDIGTALMVSNELILMKEGKLIKKGSAKEVLTRNLLDDIYDTDIIAYYSAMSEAVLSGEILSQDI